MPPILPVLAPKERRHQYWRPSRPRSTSAGEESYGRHTRCTEERRCFLTVCRTQAAVRAGLTTKQALTLPLGPVTEMRSANASPSPLAPRTSSLLRDESERDL